MRVEKNVDGSYALTCCDFEVIALESALSAYAEQTEKQNNYLYKKGEEKWFPMQNYANKLWMLAGQIYAKLPEDRTVEEVKRCHNCESPLENGEPKCKATHER